MMLLLLATLIYIVLMVLWGMLVIGLAGLFILVVVVIYFMYKYDKKRTIRKSKAEVLSDLYKMMTDKQFIQLVDEESKKGRGYHIKHRKVDIQEGYTRDEDLEEVFKRLEKFWDMRGVRIQLLDRTKIVFGGYQLSFKDKGLSNIQRERSLTKLKREESELKEIVERDRLVKGEVVKVINMLKSKEEETRKALVKRGSTQYRIDQGGLGRIEERNMAELIRYIEGWEEEVEAGIIERGGRQWIRIYIAENKEGVEK